MALMVKNAFYLEALSGFVVLINHFLIHHARGIFSQTFPIIEMLELAGD